MTTGAAPAAGSAVIGDAGAALLVQRRFRGFKARMVVLRANMHIHTLFTSQPSGNTGLRLIQVCGVLSVQQTAQDWA
jgi:hypothetical protein